MHTLKYHLNAYESTYTKLYIYNLDPFYKILSQLTKYEEFMVSIIDQ